MEYISSKQAAKKWRLSVRQVQISCAKGKIPGVKYMGKQWIIPKNATKPIDGRTKKAKNSIIDAQYHFPLMIYSNIYSYHSECNDLEMVLLKAQNLNLEGSFTKSINLAKYVLKNTTEGYLEMGAYTLLAYNYLYQDDFTNLKISLLEMTNLYKNEVLYKEDFKLIIEGLKFLLTFDGTKILNLDPSQMSSEGLIYFECMMNLVNAFSPTVNAEIDSLRTSLFTKRLDIEGLEPGLLLMGAVNSALNCIKENQYSELFNLPVCKNIVERNNWGSFYERTLFIQKKILDNAHIESDIKFENHKNEIDCWIRNSKNYQ